MNRFKQRAISIAQAMLPETVKKSIFHVAFNLSPDEFEAFSYKYAFAPNMKMGLQAAAERGISPRTIIDIGAFQGHWSEMARSIWPSAKIIMIEPNAQLEPRVQEAARKLDAVLIEELIGAEDGSRVEFFVMKNGSSIFNENSSLNREVETRSLTTLDSAILSIEGPAFLKIDAQGYELEILKGASRVLADVCAVLLEVSVIEINKGAPLIDEVLSFMKRAGFVSYDILELHRRPLDRALNQLDILFVRADSPIIADKRHFV